MAAKAFFKLDPDKCQCQNCGQCLKPYAHCHKGVCSCKDLRLDLPNRRCVDSMSVLPGFNPTTGNYSVDFICPHMCECGCQDEVEDCIEGKCYCKETKELVSPILTDTGHLAPETFIQRCPRVLTTSSGKEGNSTEVWQGANDKDAAVVVFAAIAFLVLGIVVAFGFHAFKRFKRQQQQQELGESLKLQRTLWLSSIKTTNDVQTDVTIPLVPNPLYPSIDDCLRDKMIPLERIEVQCELACGQFGKVFKGILKPLERSADDEDERLEVAIKVPKLSTIKPDSLSDFYQEAITSVNFDHENILKCLGISNGPRNLPWLLFEYMPFGDLAAVLLANSGITSFQNDKLPILKQDDLWSFCLQISRGMLYLTNRRFIHRDLAARNCLLSANLVVKISDFGLTRGIYNSDYYQMGDHRMLPIRWMAPETIQYTSRKFSPASDVWAFGVVLWEIFTFGQKPYYTMSNQEVLIKVPEGFTLNPPENCPHVIKELMLRCWQRRVENRCTFAEIVSVLEKAFSLGLGAQFNNPGYDVVPKITPGSALTSLKDESTYEQPLLEENTGYIDVLK